MTRNTNSDRPSSTLPVDADSIRPHARDVRGETDTVLLSDQRLDLAKLTASPLNGRYRIERELGRGGMGRVFAAHDLKLDRDVAIKILAGGDHSDHQLRRFEQEARAASSLNHPNIVTVYDVGVAESGPFIVSELLQGSTLRTQLEKALQPERASDYAAQLAHGLAAAHEKGVVHRDIKPENLFITSEGQLKILDFGIAKLTEICGRGATTPVSTEIGTVLGTPGYMSPEQVRGEPADHRSDIFAFGTILFEMLSGTQPFGGATNADVQSAILGSEPPDLPDAVPRQLDRIVRRCLAKRPGQRFQSAKDLAFNLEDLQAPRSDRRKAPRRARFAMAVGAIGFALFSASVAFLAGHRTGEPPQLRFQRLTFRRGPVWSARFGADGHSILYSAAWDGQPVQLYVTTPSGLESRSYDVPGTLLAVSTMGELAIGPQASPIPRPGTLALLNLSGGAPRELLTDVVSADWAPTGELAVVRWVAGRSRVELPPGHVLYETPDLLSDVRVSRVGGHIAFIDFHTGTVMLLDRAAHATALTPQFGRLVGVGWSPTGEEVWFAKDESLRAITLSGRQRFLASLPGHFTVHDVASNGTVLLARNASRLLMRGRAPGAASERDLSWLDLSSSVDLSYDGKMLLFNELGEGGGPNGRAYVRGSDGSPPIKLAEGFAMSLSPDGRRAMLRSHEPEPQPEVAIVPVGPGEPKILSFPVSTLLYASWFPDGRQILFIGREKLTGPARLFVLDEATGSSRPITEEGVQDDTLDRNHRPISPDGKQILVHRTDGFALYPVDGGERRPVRGLTEGDVPIGWTPDNNSLLVLESGVNPAIEIVTAVDPTTGRRHPWGKLMPPDSAGVVAVFNVRIAASGDAYVYTYASTLSELYLSTGLK